MVDSNRRLTVFITIFSGRRGSFYMLMLLLLNTNFDLNGLNLFWRCIWPAGSMMLLLKGVVVDIKESWEKIWFSACHQCEKWRCEWLLSVRQEMTSWVNVLLLKFNLVSAAGVKKLIHQTKMNEKIQYLIFYSVSITLCVSMQLMLKAQSPLTTSTTGTVWKKT